MKKQLREFSLWLSGNLNKSMGITSQRYSVPLIVSLTSYGIRFKTLHIALESLLKQTLKPNKIILWVSDKEIQQLPTTITRLQRRGVTIAGCEDCRAFTKIIPCLDMYPEAVIVTADDDIIYPENWLETLYAEHLRHPADIVCHRARYITYLPNGQINNYDFWPNLDRACDAPLVFPLGVGGVLYPPGSLYRDVCNRALFRKLSEYNDDIWLKAMSLLKGARCRKIGTFKKDFRQVSNSQVVSLKAANLLERNDQQIAQVFSHYGINDILRAHFS